MSTDVQSSGETREGDTVGRRLLLLVAAALAGAALASSSALAAPPVLVSVTQLKRHPSATWMLPPNVKSQAIEVATQPDLASEGFFFAENVKASDLLDDLQTTWVSAYQLDPGTYYVHVAGSDESCAYVGLCPVWEWSQILTLVIPKNKPPRLLSVRWREAGHRPGPHYYVTETLRFRACDEAVGPLVARVTQRKSLGGRTYGRATFSRKLLLAKAGCRWYTIRWRLKNKFFGVGRYTITLRVRDREGAWSRVVTRSSYTRD